MRLCDRDVLDAHALHLEDPAARELVERWRRAAGDLAHYIERRSGEPQVDLVDASTLAAIFVAASDAIT
jgi:hypothetical protein